MAVVGQKRPMTNGMNAPDAATENLPARGDGEVRVHAHCALGLLFLKIDSEVVFSRKNSI